MPDEAVALEPAVLLPIPGTLVFVLGVASCERVTACIFDMART